MPTLFIIFGIRFYFFMNDHEPVHVHIMYQGKTAKIKVFPDIELMENNGLKPNIIKKALETTETYQEEIIKEWYKIFPKKD